MRERRLTIETSRGDVSGALTGGASDPVVVLAHGAGNDLGSPLLVGFAEGLADGGVGCLRFNFPYREAGRRSPDPEGVLRETWLAAFERAGKMRALRARLEGAPVWAAGKSLGGRIASLLVAEGMVAAGLVFLGYPLHAPGRPDRVRDQHLAAVRVPMLFLQGTSDPFARWDLLEGVVNKLGKLATLHAVEGGDHSFRVRGRRADDADIGRELAAVAARFIRGG